MSNDCERDERGWRIPRSGMSRQIYDQMVAGNSSERGIAKAIKQPLASVRTLRWRIISPDKHKAWRKANRHKREGNPCLMPPTGDA